MQSTRAGDPRLFLIIRPRIELEMRLASYTVVVLGSMCLSLGCQSNSAVTRVPAPHTGAISASGDYYSNQKRANAVYTPGGATRSETGETWSPRARGPIENIADNHEGRQISHEEPVRAADVDVIAAGHRTLRSLGIIDKTVLELNSLGDRESRNAYRDALIDYFTPHKNSLSDDGRARLQRNPLRILDSKDEADRELAAEAPLLSDYLNEESRNFFRNVQDGLMRIGIDYKINTRLVRGLDYYGQTTFEFVTDALGAQGTVLAGGRYDGLIKLMGGPSTPGVGWAAGVERLVMLIDKCKEDCPVFALIPMGQEAADRAHLLAEELRDGGLVVDLAYAGNVSRRMKRANRIGASAALILGDEELARNVVQIRDMKTGNQSETSLDAVIVGLNQFR